MQDMQDKFKFIEVVIGGVSNRGKFESYYEYNTNYHETAIEPDTFHSAFVHSQELLDYADKYGGKTGYDGEVSSEYLYWDLDSTDLGKSFEQAKQLVYKLQNFNPENIRIYFSGAKGFHVLYYCPELDEYSTNVHSIVKNACNYLAYNLDTHDNHIYDKTRILRSPNTINSKTGLFKIELDIGKLPTYKVEDVLELAKTKHSFVFNPTTKRHKALEETLRNAFSSSKPNLKSSKISQTELLEGIQHGFSEGARNDGLTSVAGLLRNRGFSSNIIYSFLNSINARSSSPLEERELWNIVSSVSKYSVNPLYIEPSADDIITMKEAEEIWLKLRQRSKKLKSGFKHLDNYMPFFDPGEVLMVAARSGVGKTTMGMQLCHGIAKSHDGYGLMASLEMPTTSIFVRTAMVEHSKETNTRSEYEDIVKTLLSNPQLRRKVIEQWDRLLIVDKTGVGIEQLKSYYELANEKYDYAVNNYFIDYVGLISGASDYQGLSEIARGAKYLAKNLNTRIILVVQLSRRAGDGTVPVTIDMLRDSGALEESADYILGMWLNKQRQDKIHCSLIKNRFNSPNLRFDIKNTGLYYTTEDATDENT
jgi:KaiC/GvpD/RAD55 family RecA-like ATPase